MYWPLLLLVSTQIFAQTTLSGEASRKPWGGHWWTMHTGELALGWDLTGGNFNTRFTIKQAQEFDKCITGFTPKCQTMMNKHLSNLGVDLSPMMKFDLWVKKKLEVAYQGPAPYLQYARATNNELNIHFISSDNHPHAGAAGYAGKCTGWSLSNFDYNEPTQSKVIDGILFTPADIKGILAAIYNGAQFFVPDELAMGQAYRSEGEGNTVEAYNDPAPHVLIKALEKHIKKEKKIIVADMDATEGVWNHPVYKYSVKLEKPVGNKVNGKMTLHYADDQLGIDRVFSTSSKREDLKSRELEFEMTVTNDGKVTSSRWADGYSSDNHPDSLIFGIEKGWRKSIYDYKGTEIKKEVNFQLIKKINLGTGYKVIVDDLLKKYYQ